MTRIQSTSRRAYEKKLQALVPAILRFLRKKNSTVTVTLLSDARMRFLEKKYMHKEKKIVNVLSFKNPDGFPHPETKQVVLGDVFINWDIHVREKARMKFLLVHGILHILGYRHGKKRDTIVMQKLEAQLCRHISLPVSILEPRLLKPSLRRVERRAS